ncbi:MAG: hypothetical protein CYPHOPRED_001202, partial [Cyphobasidiales sp. Tagirdzhanova-0007]
NNGLQDHVNTSSTSGAGPAQWDGILEERLFPVSYGIDFYDYEIPDLYLQAHNFSGAVCVEDGEL